MTETLPPATCEDMWIDDDRGYATCTREPGHTGPHDDAAPGMALWEVRVWT